MARMDTTETIDTTDATTDNARSTTSRVRFLQQAGLGAAGLALTGALPAALNPGRARGDHGRQRGHAERRVLEPTRQYESLRRGAQRLRQAVRRDRQV